MRPNSQRTLPSQHVENGDPLAEAGELADNEPASLGRRDGGGGRLDELVDLEAVLAGVLKDGETPPLHVLAGVRNSEIADGFHDSVYGKCRQALYLTPVK